MAATRPKVIASVSRSLGRQARPVALLGCSTLVFATSLAGQRAVTGNTIVSFELPSASIRAEEAMTYVGGTSFDLYGVADAEIHLFVESDGDRVERLLWVQFEGYHADNDHTSW